CRPSIPAAPGTSEFSEAESVDARRLSSSTAVALPVFFRFELSLGFFEGLELLLAEAEVMSELMDHRRADIAQQRSAGSAHLLHRPAKDRDHIRVSIAVRLPCQRHAREQAQQKPSSRFVAALLDGPVIALGGLILYVDDDVFEILVKGRRERLDSLFDRLAELLPGHSPPRFHRLLPAGRF